MKVGIIGGGVAGLSAAYELVNMGHEVAVFERSSRVGGQLITFEVGVTRLECFYHHIFTSDLDMIGLIQELGVGEKLRWVNTKVGFFHNSKIYDFVTPMDLLRFTPLSLFDRLRLGLVSLYLQHQADWKKYEGISAQDWLVRYAGRRTYDTVWGPLLRGKFGSSASEVGMVWFWGKIRLRFGSRAKGMGKEQLGYMLGSFGLVWDTLAQRIKDAGGKIYSGVPVRRVVVEDGRATGIEVELPEEGIGEGIRLGRTEDGLGLYSCDAVIATVPSRIFLNLVRELPEEYASKIKGLRYKAVLCLILTMKQPLSHIYWLNVGDPSIPFVAAIEQTNLVDPFYYGGKHMVYLSNYLSKEDPLYQLNADELFNLYLSHLRRLNPDFEPDWVEGYRLFKEEAAQPIITTHYSQKIPNPKTPIPGLYLANTTQIYPQDRGQNYSLRLGRQVARMAVGLEN